MAPTEVTLFSEKAMPEKWFLDEKLAQPQFFISFLHGETQSLMVRKY